MHKHTSPASTVAVAAAAALILACCLTAAASEPFIAEIRMFGFDFAPRGWAFCDGQVLPIADNSALHSLIGITFGGDDRTTFALPDLRGRIAMHVGAGPGRIPVEWGQEGGAESVTLSVNNLPTHSHAATLHVTSADGNQVGPDGNILAGDPREDQYSDVTPNVSMSAACITMTSTGGGQSFQVRNPYLGIHHCIALYGLYPSRD